MKIIFKQSVILCIFYLLLFARSYGQIRVGNVSRDFDDNGYTLLNVMIQNDGTDPVYIKQMNFQLTDIKPRTNKGSEESKELDKIAAWGISIPLNPNDVRRFKPEKIIKIAGKDAIVIQIRPYIQRNSNTFLLDSFGLYTFTMTFIDTSGQTAKTDTIQIGRQ